MEDEEEDDQESRSDWQLGKTSDGHIRGTYRAQSEDLKGVVHLGLGAFRLRDRVCQCEKGQPSGE